MLNKPCIYQIANIVNQKIYIGSTLYPYKRRREHFRLLKNNKHENCYLQNEFNKYGIDNFEFFIVEYVCSNKLSTTEQTYLDLLCGNRKKCYNIASNVFKPMLGKKHTNRTKSLMSSKRKQYTGVKHPMYGRENKWGTHSDQTKLIFSQQKTGARNPNAKSVEQIDLKTNQIISGYSCASEAARKLKICASSISKCCLKQRKTAGGFKWRFKNREI